MKVYSTVASYSAAVIVDERRVASSTIGLPRCESVKSQKSAQGAEKFHNLFTLVVQCWSL